MHVNQLAQCQPHHGSWFSANKRLLTVHCPSHACHFLERSQQESLICTYLTALAAVFCAQESFSECLHKGHGGILALCSCSSFLIAPGVSCRSSSSFEQLNSSMSLPSLGHPVSSSHIQILPAPLCPLPQAPQSIFPSTHPSCPICPFTLSSHSHSGPAGTSQPPWGPPTYFIPVIHAA